MIQWHGIKSVPLKFENFATGGQGPSLYSPIHLAFDFVQQYVQACLSSKNINGMNWRPFFMPCYIKILDLEWEPIVQDDYAVEVHWGWKEGNFLCSWWGFGPRPWQQSPLTWVGPGIQPPARLPVSNLSQAHVKYGVFKKCSLSLFCSVLLDWMPQFHSAFLFWFAAFGTAFF